MTFYELHTDYNRSLYRTKKAALASAGDCGCRQFQITRLEIDVNAETIMAILSGDGYASSQGEPVIYNRKA